MATERIYYADAYATRFTARVEAVNGARVYLDRTAFYPTSGGQPHDTGLLEGARVIDVVDEEERIAHVVEGELSEGAVVEGAIDWPRRWDHMQQHSGQHLLSAALERQFGIRTVSFHLGTESSTIDLDTLALTAEQLAEAERLANAVIQENRPLGIGYESAGEAEGLRKPSERQGTLRIITIDEFDRSACGGTHVRATGEIGALLLGKTEKIRNTTRLEFVCGMRAVARARRDFDALIAAARVFSSTLDQVPAQVAAQAARLAEAEKTCRRLEAEQAEAAGIALAGATAVSAKGLKLAVERPALMNETLRARAKGFTEAGKGVYLALCESGPSYLLAVSADSGVDATQWMKPVLASRNGKGGGSPTLAQGRVPTSADLAAIESAAREAF